jgi:uncharacterized membrane protein YkoI
MHRDRKFMANSSRVPRVVTVGSGPPAAHENVTRPEFRQKGVTMKATRRTIVNAGAATLVAVTALRSTHAETLAQAGTPTPQPAAGAETAAMEPVLRPDIDQVAAQEAALGGQPGVVVNSVKLQRANGTLRYEVDLSNGAEVFIDAATGQILPMTDDDDENEEDDDD